MKITPNITTSQFQHITTTTLPHGGIRKTTKPKALEFDYPFKKLLKWLRPRIGGFIFLIIVALFLWATWHIAEDFKF